jgi:flagellar hook-length control protein FliK
MSVSPSLAVGAANGGVPTPSPRTRPGADAAGERSDDFARLLERDLAAAPKPGEVAAGRTDPTTRPQAARGAAPATPATAKRPADDAARAAGPSPDGPRAMAPERGAAETDAESDADAGTDEETATADPAVDAALPATPAGSAQSPATRVTPAGSAVPADAALERPVASAVERGAPAAAHLDFREARTHGGGQHKPTVDDATPAAAVATPAGEAPAERGPTPDLGTWAAPAEVAKAAVAPAAPATMVPVVGADALAAAGASAVGAEAASPVAGSAPTPSEARLPHPPHSPAFAAALGQQVSLWIRHGVQQAVLQLNPAELGPVSIHIALDGARAHVDFTAPHAATRAALEGSLPVLAGALRDSGLTLAGGGVFDRPREQAGGNGQTPAWSGDTPRADGRRDESPLLPPPSVPRRRGVVDLVA